MTKVLRTLELDLFSGDIIKGTSSHLNTYQRSTLDTMVTTMRSRVLEGARFFCFFFPLTSGEQSVFSEG